MSKATQPKSHPGYDPGRQQTFKRAQLIADSNTRNAPNLNRLTAAFNFGRLLNELNYHFQHVLFFPAYDKTLVDGVLDRLAETSYVLVVKPPKHLRDTIFDVRKRWRARLCSDVASDDVAAYVDDYERPWEFGALYERRKQRVASWIDPLLNKVRVRARKNLSEAEMWVLELGQRLDEVIRPSDVHRYFEGWVDVPVESRPAGLFPAFQALSERRQIWRPPQLGDFDEDTAWPGELQELLTRIGIPDAGAEILTEWMKQARSIPMPRIIDELDGAIREQLDALASPVLIADESLDPKPEVEGTDDAYVPANTLWRDHFGTYKQAKAFLDDNTATIRTKRPRKNRLLVHAADWLKHWAEETKQQFNSLDVDPEVVHKAIETAQRRKQQVDASRRQENSTATPPSTSFLKPS